MLNIITISALVLTHASSWASKPSEKPSQEISALQKGTFSPKIAQLAECLRAIPYFQDDNVSASPCAIELKKFLDEKPTHIDDYDLKGYTLLMHSVIHYSPTLHKLICSYKPNVNAQNKNKQTALHLAMARENYAALKQLVDLKPDLSIKDHEGDTVCQDGKEALAHYTYLLSRSPFETENYLRYRNKKITIERMLRLLSNNPMYQEYVPDPDKIAHDQSIIEVIQLIKKYPSDIKQISSRQQLNHQEIQAAINSMERIHSFLNQDPRHINIQEPIFDGNTVFMYIAQSPNSSLRRVCHELPAHIDARNKRSQTALHIGILEACPEAFKELVDYGATQQLVDLEGNTAKMIGQKRVAQLTIYIASLDSYRREFEPGSFSKASLRQDLEQEKTAIEQKLSYLTH